MVWATYHSGGEKAPRIQLVRDGVVLDQIDLDDTAAAAVNPSIDYWARLKDERFVQDVELRKRIDGIKQPQKGGFYYETKVECPLLDKTSAGIVLGIINHCATAGNNYVYFFPHLDNITLKFVAFIAGEVKPFERGGRAFYFAHTAELQVYGLEPLPRVPFTEIQTFLFWENGAVYAPTEIGTMMMWQSGAAYADSEKASELGYYVKKNSVYNFAD